MRALLGYCVLLLLLAACAPPGASVPPTILPAAPSASPAPSSPPTPTTAPAPTPSIPAAAAPPDLILGNWHEMIYHEATGQMVLLNGGPESGKAAGEPVELWRWQGDSWALLSADPEGPRWRNFASAAYDSTRGVLVLYGGVQPDGTAFEDTWEWDGQRWSQRASGGPGGREGSGMAFDAGRQRIVLFGGSREGEMMGDTWEWDGSEWLEVAAEGPQARFPAGFSYDAAREVIVLFGGHSVDAQGFTTHGDTWTWNGAQWELAATAGPPPRDGGRTVYDPLAEQILLFGGAQVGSTVTYLDDMWRWRGTQWEPIVEEVPPGRVHAAMALDAARGVVVMTGGSNAPGVVLGDTWEWDGQEWVCRAGCE